jgi:hypothetical protein
MLEHAVAFLVRAYYAYTLAGCLFAILFVIRGVQMVDVQARGAGVGFRLLIFPGVIAFWPLLLRRWFEADGEAPAERNAHR